MIGRILCDEVVQSPICWTGIIGSGLGRFLNTSDFWSSTGKLRIRVTGQCSLVFLLLVPLMLLRAAFSQVSNELFRIIPLLLAMENTRGI